MANQRYFIKCPVCLERTYFAKSLGAGIYIINPSSEQHIFLNEKYDWMWKHMMECHKDEFKEGQLFSIEAE